MPKGVYTHKPHQGFQKGVFNGGGFKKGNVYGGSSFTNFKGDNVGYSGVHQWITKIYGKADVCDKCNSVKWVQWANLSGKYRRSKKDWMKLCFVCHRKYDGITKLSKENAQVIRSRYKSGETQESIAIDFRVHQSTISNIIRNKIQYYAT